MHRKFRQFPVNSAVLAYLITAISFDNDDDDEDYSDNTRFDAFHFECSRYAEVALVRLLLLQRSTLLYNADNHFSS